MNRLKRENGFTLIEVMVAMFILLVGILAHAAFTITVIRENSNSGNYSSASALAQDKLEELTNLPFTNPMLADIKTGNNNANGMIDISPLNADHQESNIDERGNAGGFYERTWNIWTVSPSRKDIVVIVSWKSGNGKIKKVRVSTIKSI